MTAALDTNVLVRLLVRDDEPQFQAALKAIRKAVNDAGQVLVTLLVILETEWVLRSRYQLAKDQIAQAFVALLDSADLLIEEEAVLEEALSLWRDHAADFADCLIAARSRRLGCAPLLTFDAKAAKLPDAQLLKA